MRFIQLLVLLLLVVILPAQRAFADDEVTEDANGNLPFGYVRSVDAINSGVHATGNSLGLAAEYAIQHRYYDQAIKICQRAIGMLDDDADIHMAYASALEGKLRRQKQKDPNLFMAAVREWLIVARNEKGEERGLTNKRGVALPGVQHLFQDEERSMPAVHHLVGLVGYPPKLNEPDDKYLRRVAKQCENSVKGRIMQKQNAPGTSEQSSADSKPEPASGQTRAAQSKRSEAM